MDSFEKFLPPTQGFTLFYGHTKGPDRVFSNFYPSEFKDPSLYPSLEGLDSYRDSEGAIVFQHVEQYMHALKAIIFKDFDILDKIMVQGADQATSKRLGRAVSNFDDEVWGSVARQVVARGCLLKFQQSEELRMTMEKTGETALVECAPRDRRWGIGLGRDNPRALQPSKWRGTNWLGQCLVRARLAMETGEKLALPTLSS